MEKFAFHEARDRFRSTNNTSETMEEQNRPDCYAEGIDSSISDYGFRKDSSNFFHENESFLRYDRADESRYNIFAPPLHTCFQEMAELGEILQNENQDVRQPKKTVQNRLFLPSLQLLNTHNQGMKRLDSERFIEPTIDPLTVEVLDNVYSTENIMRIAAERFMQSFCRTSDVVSMLDNPFDFSLSYLPDEVAKKVELAELLMASAEKVGDDGLYDHARMLLNRCDELSSSAGNAVERVVHYFSKALRERIDEKTGKTTSEGSRKQQLVKIDEAFMALNPKLLTVYREVPFAQIAHSAGIQAVIENVSGAEKIHVIDLGIRTGVQWTGFMQTLASDSGRPLTLLKITAVGTTTKTFIEDTGKRLTSFAESIRLPFLFNILTVSDMLELHQDQFDLEHDETVVVYSAYILKRLILVPDKLDYMMNVIQMLKPSIMVVIEPDSTQILRLS